ncbi:MAG: Rpn family recombination-promoting nuclease/putative transposase [Defluviitaleaceae bacterium]|nr:Rpn family recombination-promoting nuclease/putative transposase [Defluviitaleaceae bacterium]
MPLAKPLLELTNDVVFKAYFRSEKNRYSLISFLRAVLNIKEEDFIDLKILDPLSIAEQEDDKSTVIDLRLELKDQVIIIELQMQPMELMENRIVFGISKNLSTQLIKGDSYKLTKIVSILIAGFPLIKDKNHKEYHDIFNINSKKTGYTFSDVIEIHTLELKKLPKNEDGTLLYNWLKVIRAKSEEELDMIAENVPELKQSVSYIKELSADESARIRAFNRETFLRDQAVRERMAREQGIKEEKISLAKNLIEMNVLSLEQISKGTGLSINEIEKIKNKIG